MPERRGKRKKGNRTNVKCPTDNNQKWRPAKFHRDVAKVPLLVFGDNIFNKDSVKAERSQNWSHWCSVESIKRREKDGDLLTIEIDEFKTLRLCFRCYGDSLNKEEGFKDHSVIGCSNCKTLWQRDINVAKNMSLIASYIWNG